MPSERSPVDFNSFGNDLKEARKRLKISRRKFAEIVDMDWRYLANIENSGFIPSLPLFHDLVVASKLPVEKYFFPETGKQRSKAHEDVKWKIDNCPEKYLSFVEAVIDEAIRQGEAESE